MKYDASDPDWPDRDRFVLSAGPRVDAALLDAVPHRLRPRARRPPPVPPVGLAHARPPRVPPHEGCRGHDRSARPGHRATRSASRSPRSTCAARFGRRGLRPPHVRHLQRRRPHGGHQPRGRRRSPVTCSSAAWCSSTTTTTSRSTAPPSSPTATTFPKRFEAYGWHVVQLGEVANDLDALEAGLRAAMAEEGRPTLLVLRSHIGYPSPKVQDTAAAHGNPLGADEVARGEGDPRPSARRLLRARRRARSATARPARAAARPAAWTQAQPGLAANPDRADEYEACSSGPACSAVGSRSCRRGRRASSHSRRATASKEVLSAVVDSCPGLFTGVGRPHRQHRHGRSRASAC